MVCHPKLSLRQSTASTNRLFLADFGFHNGHDSTKLRHLSPIFPFLASSAGFIVRKERSTASRVAWSWAIWSGMSRTCRSSKKAFRKVSDGSGSGSSEIVKSLDTQSSRTSSSASSSSTQYCRAASHLGAFGFARFSSSICFLVSTIASATSSPSLATSSRYVCHFLTPLRLREFLEQTLTYTEVLVQSPEACTQLSNK
eukprot:s779_g16.t1